MLTPGPGTRAYLAGEPVDLRCGYVEPRTRPGARGGRSSACRDVIPRRSARTASGCADRAVMQAHDLRGSQRKDRVCAAVVVAEFNLERGAEILDDGADLALYEPACREILQERDDIGHRGSSIGRV